MPTEMESSRILESFLGKWVGENGLRPLVLKTLAGVPILKADKALQTTDLQRDDKAVNAKVTHNPLH